MCNTKVNSTLLKNVNRKKILSVIDKVESISRVEVKNLLGKDGKTVTNIVNGLIEDGFITNIGLSSFTGGRRRKLLTINPNYGYLIGIHLGIHFLRGMITDFKYKIIVEEKIPISPNESELSLIQKIKKTLDFLVKSKNIPKDKLLGIGFVANGFYDDTEGIWINSVNNLHWKNIPIRKILSEQYDIPVYLEDSSRSMTLAEKVFGCVQDKNNFIYLDLGVGIGCGIIYKDRLYKGPMNISGELGHTIVVPNGALCSCGNRGCLETVASGWAINKIAKDRISAGEESEIINLCDGDLNKLETDMIFKAFENGDKLANEILESASDYLGIGIANLINLFNPEVIVFGGHFATINESFLNNLKAKIKKYTMPLLFNNVKILTSTLNDNAGILGATTLVRDPYFHIDTIK
jgi:glucokinase-like ROK family protein